MVTFYSSPYLRCIQTSAGISEGIFGGSLPIKVNVREELSEMQMGSYNNEAEIDKLAIR
jgi:broad specificity phosphatase PhoE